MTRPIDEIDAIVARARCRRPPPGLNATAADRRRILDRVADELNSAPAAGLLSAMVHEGHKTVAEADVGDRRSDRLRPLVRTVCARSWTRSPGAVFRPLGVVAGRPAVELPGRHSLPAESPAALAAGNAVILKPAPETPRCAEIVAEACWAAGVPPEALQFVRTHDDEVGRRHGDHEGSTASS